MNEKIELNDDVIQCHGEDFEKVRCTNNFIIKEVTVINGLCEFYSQYCHTHKFQQNDNIIVKKRILEYFNVIEETRGKYNRRKIIIKMFNYIIDNIKFLDQDDLFKDAVLETCDEFIINQNLDEFIIIKDTIVKKLSFSY
jgi:hypothetical protein